MSVAQIAHCHVTRAVRFVPIPKNASTSILAAMFMLEGTPQEIHERKPGVVPWLTEDPRPTFAVVRSPTARLVSTWRNKIKYPHRPDTALITRHGFPLGSSLEYLVSALEERGTRAFDRHLAPQHTFLPDVGQVTLLAQERLAQDWYRAGLQDEFGQLEHLNRTEKGVDLHETSAFKLLARIAALYEDDAKLWRYAMQAHPRRIF